MQLPRQSCRDSGQVIEAGVQSGGQGVYLERVETEQIARRLW